MSLEIILTEDGSSSLLVPELDETYHSIRGAINESKHVFIDAGLKHRQSLNSNPNINILEIGFGTGLNTLLTALNCGTSTIYYTSIESRPLPKNIWGKLNYPRPTG